MCMRKPLILASLILWLVVPSPAATALAEPPSLTPADAWAEISRGAFVLDARTSEEYAEGHLPGAVLIPYDEVQKRLSEFGQDKARRIVVYCHSGRRAGFAQEKLLAAGFKNVFNAGALEDLERYQATHGKTVAQ